MSYASFAQYYDSLTHNVEYARRADYLCTLLAHLGHAPGLTLDLACGTGSLTVELAKRGMDIYGIDGSADMLSVARQKAAESGLDLLFLCQKMQKLDLYGTVDTVICALDSINHLTLKKDVQTAFDRVSLFMNPGGWFLFDVNTVYKHRHVLADNIFLYDTDEVYCIWQNHYEEKNDRVGIQLDFFGREGNLYHRSGEHFYERAYPQEQLLHMLNQAGFDVVYRFADLSLEEPGEQEERVVFAARKKK